MSELTYDQKRVQKLELRVAILEAEKRELERQVFACSCKERA